MAKDHLYELVKALSPAEVKHFRKAAGSFPNQGPNNYLRLFEALLQVETYVESEVKARFRGEGLEKYFPNVKRYLYNRLLSFLAARQVGKDVRAVVEEKLREAEALWKKGLYDQSEKLYRRAVRRAGEAGLHELEVRGLTFLARDHIARRGNRSWEKLLELEAEQQQALRRFQEETRWRQLHNKLFLLARQYFGMGKPEALARAKRLMQDSLLRRKVEEIDFFEGKRLRLLCLASYAGLSSNARENARLSKEIVALWEAHPDMIRFYPNLYRIDISNQLGRSGALMDFRDFPQALGKLHAIPAASRDEEGEVFQNTAFFELLFLMNTGQFETARQILPDIENGLQRFSDKVNQARQFAFRYNMMVLNFVLEDYSEALRQLNLILNDERTEHRQDIQQVARIFLLIFHFELGNLDLLEYLFRSAYRYLYARDSIGRFERAILSFLRRSGDMLPGPAMHPAFEELLEELKAIRQSKPKRVPPGMDELVYWLRGKLEGKKIVDVAKEEIGEGPTS